jgi:hypothetical protein
MTGPCFLLFSATDASVVALAAAQQGGPIIMAALRPRLALGRSRAGLRRTRMRRAALIATATVIAGIVSAGAPAVPGVRPPGGRRAGPGTAWTAAPARCRT